MNNLVILKSDAESITLTKDELYNLSLMAAWGVSKDPFATDYRSKLASRALRKIDQAMDFAIEVPDVDSDV